MNLKFIVFFIFALVFINTNSAALPDKEAVIASRGGADLTFGDIDDYLERIPDDKRANFMYSAKRVESVINMLLLHRQIAKEMREQGMEKLPEFSAYSGVNLEEKLANKKLEELAQVAVPDLEALAEETYLSNKKNFVVRGAIDVQLILISHENKIKEEAKALAEQVRAEALAKPENFSELVKKYSESEEKNSSDGLLVDVLNKDVGIPIKEAAAQFRESKTTISEVVSGARAYYILKLVKLEPDYQQTYQEARTELLYQLKQQYIDQYRKDYVTNLTNQPLEANPELIASLRTRYLPPGSKSPDELIKEMKEAKQQGRAIQQQTDQKQDSTNPIPAEK